MRILHIFDHSLPLQSGYVTRSLGVLRSQHALGWETVHLTSRRHGFYAGKSAEVESADGLTFHRTPGGGTGLPGFQELLDMRAVAKRLATLVKAERPDILHAHSPVLNVLPALAVARRFGLPVVYEVRALWEDAAVDLQRSREGSLRYRLSRWIDTRAFHRVGGIVALCEPLRAEIVARGIDPARVSVVPNAVDPRFLEPAGTTSAAARSELGLGSGPVLGYIGSFYSYEGLGLLVDALDLLRGRRPDLTLLLVGGGPEEQRLKERVAELRLQDRVIFVGRVKLEEVTRYYQALDLLVFPRRRMRLTELVTPLKPLEAMAQGKPVLASDVGGHRELVRHKETGLLFPADDVTALAAAIEGALADRAGTARIAAAGRHFVTKERNWHAVGARYAPIYEALLAARRT